ncbi:hypothetical protein DL89DRAFT_269364 [Linderina pennispora]|uniref:Uncharacterized protein n=1 Tax=Linderina pennispora TaxID=61395 RepID=A0A1Y1W253_9FUNG|nr:uncharacterized protein DL89DRAFT_269364 [Linderina pennispora]ORX67567.1 hypothetical protein DL89DRAFT_269364 [Linderina pennispora]
MDKNTATTVSLIYGMLTALPATAYYIPAFYYPQVGGMVGSVANGNGIQAAWGPSGFTASSNSPGFNTHMDGQFSPSSGSVSDSVSRSQTSPVSQGLRGLFYPGFGSLSYPGIGGAFYPYF